MYHIRHHEKVQEDRQIPRPTFNERIKVKCLNRDGREIKIENGGGKRFLLYHNLITLDEFKHGIINLYFPRDQFGRFMRTPLGRRDNYDIRLLDTFKNQICQEEFIDLYKYQNRMGLFLNETFFHLQLINEITESLGVNDDSNQDANPNHRQDDLEDMEEDSNDTTPTTSDRRTRKSRSGHQTSIPKTQVSTNIITRKHSKKTSASIEITQDNQSSQRKSNYSIYLYK